MEKKSMSLDRRVLKKADSFARRRGMKRQELILAALNWLDRLRKEKWDYYEPDGWPDNRILRETSFSYPKGEEAIINKMKNKGGYPFVQIIEIALWGYMLKSREPDFNVKNKSKKYRCTKCFHSFFPKEKIECPKCKGHALTEKMYNTRKLNQTMDYLKNVSDEAPVISDINAEIIKRFLIRKIKRKKKTITGDYFADGMGLWLLKVLEGFGERYIKDELGRFKEQRMILKKDWLKALEFFLWHAYFQGRGDELAISYFKAAKKALSAYFGKNTSIQNKRYNRALKNNWIPQSDDWERFPKRNNDLWKALKNEEAGTTRDMEMVIDSLHTVKDLPSRNIVLYALDKIKKKNLNDLINDVNSIYRIKPETILWFIQDLALVFNVKLSNTNNKTLIPMAGWVKTFLNRIGADFDDQSEIMPTSFFKACVRFKIDPKKVNVGTYFVGEDLIIKLLDNPTF